LQSLEIPGVGAAHLLEAVGTTQNLKGEPMLDKMAARCTALNVESGDKKYIDGACALTDKDGDVIFSTFDTRDLDASQPQMKCGTHIITGGSGKYAGITGREPFACNDMPKLAGTGGYSPWTFRTTQHGKSSPRPRQNTDVEARAISDHNGDAKGVHQIWVSRLALLDRLGHAGIKIGGDSSSAAHPSA
jgi:hypothetical protein